MNFYVTVAVLAAFSVSMASSQSQSTLTEDTCLSGDGSSYRGDVSISKYGRQCLSWKRVRHPWGASDGIAKHNYCRNPDQSLMPWCYIRRGRRFIREFCNINKCQTDTELTCGERFEQRQDKIVGGSFTHIESHPWLAAIFIRGNTFLCGGSLIAPSWVLTAAHCFPDGTKTDIKRLTVYLGRNALNETDDAKEQSFNIEDMIIHTEFNEDTYDNDIALLKIKGSNGACAMKSPFVRTVCLPPSRTQLSAGFQCSVAGYGREAFDSWHYSQYLKNGEVKLLSRTDCNSKSHYDNRITHNMICAASPDWRTDACKGDSGGPLVCDVAGRMFLFGIVSWGEDCAKKNKPGVYTQVTNYNSWIAEKTRLSKYTEGIMYPRK